MTVRQAAAIAAGAVVGAGLRWATMRVLGDDGSDVALLVANVIGCCLLGAVMCVPATGPHVERTTAFTGAGFCGSLTTWSSLALAAAVDVRAGRWAEASSWISANVAFGLVAAFIGVRIGSALWPLEPGSDGGRRAGVA